MTRIGLSVGAIASSAAPGGGGGGGGGGTIVPRIPIQVYDETPSGTRSFVTTGKGVAAGDFVELYWFQAGYPNTNNWADISGWTPQVNVNITGWGQMVVATRTATVTAAEADGGSAHQIDVSFNADQTELAAVIQCYGGVTTGLDQAAGTLGGSSDFVDPSVINVPGYTTVHANSYYTLAYPARGTAPAWDTSAAVAAGYTVLGAFTSGTHVNWCLLGKAHASGSTVQAATTITVAGIQYEYASKIGKY